MHAAGDGELAGDLLVQLYDATLHADAWPRILRLLAPLFGCTQASFIRIDRTHPRDSITTLVGFAPAVAEALRNRNIEHDYFWQALLTRPAGSVVLSSEALPGDAYRRGPIYHDIAVPNGLDHSCAMVLENRAEEFTAMSFLRGGQDFDAGHRARLAGLAPHLRAILQLTRRVALGDAGRREALRSFDRAGQPLVVLDRSGYAIYCNDVAGRILGQADGVELKLGRFLFDNLSAQAEFERAVRLAVAATGGADAEPVPREVRVPRRRAGSPFALSVISCARASDRAVLPPGADL
jgi:PAS domain-containing protein